MLRYSRALGKGGVVYIALGHRHSPTDNRQRVLDVSVYTSEGAPRLFRGSWETASFGRLLRNGITWGIEQEF